MRKAHQHTTNRHDVRKVSFRMTGLDINTIVSGFLTGSVSGGLTALVIGFLKSRLLNL